MRISKFPEENKSSEPISRQEDLVRMEGFGTEQIATQFEKEGIPTPQRPRIHYNCAGTIEIPRALPLPTPRCVCEYKKGVVVSYALHNRRMATRRSSWRRPSLAKSKVKLSVRQFQ